MWYFTFMRRGHWHGLNHETHLGSPSFIGKSEKMQTGCHVNDMAAVHAGLRWRALSSGWSTGHLLLDPWTSYSDSSARRPWESWQDVCQALRTWNFNENKSITHQLTPLPVQHTHTHTLAGDTLDNHQPKKRRELFLCSRLCAKAIDDFQQVINKKRRVPFFVGCPALANDVWKKKKGHNWE